MNKHLLTIAFALSTFVLMGEASASPWLLRANEVVISGRYDFQQASSEFLDEGRAQNFPLRGELIASTFEISGRVGLFDDFELQLSIPVKTVAYKSDPVILLPAPEEQEGIDYYQNNVIDLSRNASGVGDVRLSGFYQLVRGRFASSVQLSAKFPTGYDSPAGTFGDQPKSQQDFLENVGTLVSPENVQDDVTLGDGQLDLGLALHAGYAFKSGTFARVMAGYDLRLAGAGDQVVGEFRIGQALGKRVLVSAGASGEYAVQDGDLIGISVAAENPDLPANQYGGTNNLALREVRLDRDSFTVSGGVIVRITNDIEAGINYGRILAGRNLSQVQTVSVSVGVRIPAP